VLVWYRVGETEGNGNFSVLFCTGFLQGEREGGNGNVSVVMCAGLVRCGGEGGKWQGFSGDVCWFGTGWGRRREIDKIQW
jgi:hypothetical protein